MVTAAAEVVLRAAERVVGPPLIAATGLRDRGLIVLYHRVSPEGDDSYPPLNPDEFERHCDYLSRAFSVVPLDELLARRATGKPVGGCCAVTFDDGYRDFLDFAYPILQRYQLPVTHFLVKDCIDSGRPTWNLRLNRVVHVRRNRGERIETAPLKATLGGLAREDRYAWLLQAEDELRGTLPAEPPMLRSEDLPLFSDLVRWASHTVSHATLTSSSVTELDDELLRSLDFVRGLRGGHPWLSYPNGCHDGRVREAAKKAGYTAAFGVGQGRVSSRDAAEAIPRVDLGAVPAQAIRLEIAGTMQMARRSRGRLAGRR